MKYYGRYKVKQAVVPSSRSLLSTEEYQCSRKWVTGKMGSKRGGHLSSVEWGRELFLLAQIALGWPGWQDSSLCRRESNALESCWAPVLQLDTGKPLAKSQEDCKWLESPGEVWQHRCVRVHPEHLAPNLGGLGFRAGFPLSSGDSGMIGLKTVGLGGLL